MAQPGRGPAALLLALALTACGTTVSGSAASQASLGDGLGGTSAPVATGTLGTGGSSQAGTSTGAAQAPGSPGYVPPAGLPSAVSPTSTSGGPVQPAATGAAATHAPLSLGIVLTGTSNAAALGLSFGNSVSEKSVDDALVAALNAQGGLGGRRIEPVYASTDTGGDNWESEFAEVCATFTQDHHVAAVLGYVFDYFASFENCLNRQHIVHLDGGFNIPDNATLAAYPLFKATITPTAGRRDLLKLDGAFADGVLTTKTKLGIISDSCPGSLPSYNQVLVPEARRLGLTISKLVTISCANGESDASSATTAITNAVLAFESAGVTQILLHTASEGPGLLLLMEAAQTQGYHPGYVVSSLANLAQLEGDLPPNQAKNVNAYGWLASEGVVPSAYPARTASQTRCLALLRSRGIVPKAGPDFFYAYSICEPFFTYEAALKATHGSTTGTAVIAAINGLGSSLGSTTNLGGSTYSAAAPDAVEYARHLVFSGGCSCFVYTGPVRRIGAV